MKVRLAMGLGWGMPVCASRSQNAQRTRGLTYTAANYQLANGSAGAIDLICRALIEPGDVILCESPTYMGTLRNFYGVGAVVKAVPMDAGGMDIDALERTIIEVSGCGQTIKFIYIIATFQNPTGATLGVPRREQLLALAAKHKILILDDDAYAEIYFGDAPPPMLAQLSGGEGVLTVGTFSKVLATGLRIGWIAGPAALVELIGTMRFAMGLNQIMVRVIAGYMASGELDEHAKRIRVLYRTRMNRLADALDEHLGNFATFERPEGGFYLWLRLAQGLAAEDVWRAAAEEGVMLTPGVNFFPGRVDVGSHLRIAFPWTPIDQLSEGARRLGRACERAAAGDVP